MTLEQRIRKLAEAYTTARLTNEEHRTANMRALDHQKTLLMKLCDLDGKARLTPMYFIAAGLAQILSQPQRLNDFITELSAGMETTIRHAKDLSE